MFIWLKEWCSSHVERLVALVLAPRFAMMCASAALLRWTHCSMCSRRAPLTLTGMRSVTLMQALNIDSKACRLSADRDKQLRLGVLVW
eukprot:4882960-Amphidinium_carterae.1